MRNKEGGTQIVNVMTPWAVFLAEGCGDISFVMKMDYFFKDLFFYSKA